jgi:hypothetical protein
MGDPWFKFYSSEYLLDARVNSMPLAAQSILVKMWCVCHQIGDIPDDPILVSRLIGVSAKTVRAHWDYVRIMFVSSESDNGMMRSLRLDYERIKSASKRDRQSIGASKTNRSRWGAESLSESLSDSSMEDGGGKESPLPTQKGLGDGLLLEGQTVAQKPSLQKTPVKWHPRRDAEETLGFSDGVGKLISDIMAECPKVYADRAIRVDIGMLGTRLEGIIAQMPESEPYLVQAWRSYVASKPIALKAPQYFFGKQENQIDGANWKPWARVCFMADKQRKQKEQQKEV